MKGHASPAIEKRNPPEDEVEMDAKEVREGSKEKKVPPKGTKKGGKDETEEQETPDPDQKKLSGKELSQGKTRNFVPLVKTGKPEGEKTKRAPEDLLKNKKQDGCGCPLKKKKKMDALTRENLDACWKNYEQKGMKKKGGKTVPNCVPKGSKGKNVKNKQANPTMKKDSVYASGFKFDGKCLHMGSEKLAATETDRAKRKKNAQGQPRNKIMAGTRNT